MNLPVQCALLSRCELPLPTGVDRKLQCAARLGSTMPIRSPGAAALVQTGRKQDMSLAVWGLWLGSVSFATPTICNVWLYHAAETSFTSACVLMHLRQGCDPRHKHHSE